MDFSGNSPKFDDFVVKIFVNFGQYFTIILYHFFYHSVLRNLVNLAKFLTLARMFPQLDFYQIRYTYRIVPNRRALRVSERLGACPFIPKIVQANSCVRLFVLSHL